MEAGETVEYVEAVGGKGRERGGIDLRFFAMKRDPGGSFAEGEKQAERSEDEDGKTQSR